MYHLNLREDLFVVILILREVERPASARGKIFCQRQPFAFEKIMKKKKHLGTLKFCLATKNSSSKSVLINSVGGKNQ